MIMQTETHQRNSYLDNLVVQLTGKAANCCRLWAARQK